MWPGREPDKGRTLLRTALAEIRRTLEPGRPTGEPGRFLATAGERVALDATTDLAEAAAARDHGDVGTAFALLRPGLAELDGAGDWYDDLRRSVEAERTEVADRVVAGGDGALVGAALEVLVDAEPWQRSHVDALAAWHRDRGDEPAARAVERRWFADE